MLVSRCVWDCSLLEAGMSPCFVVACVGRAVHFSRFAADAIYLVVLWIAPVVDPWETRFVDFCGAL